MGKDNFKKGGYKSELKMGKLRWKHNDYNMFRGMGEFYDGMCIYWDMLGSKKKRMLRRKIHRTLSLFKVFDQDSSENLISLLKGISNFYKRWTANLGNDYIYLIDLVRMPGYSFHLTFNDKLVTAASDRDWETN